MSECVEVLVPRINTNDDDAVLVSWHVDSGCWVDAEQTLVTLETTKATFDVSAPVGGYAFFEHAPKTLVPVGSTIVWISASKQQPQPQTSVSARPSSAAATETPHCTRKALKRMAELGLAPADFQGTERVDVDVVERVARGRGALESVAAVADVETETLEQSATKIFEAKMLGEVYRQVVPSTVATSMSRQKILERLRQFAPDAGVDADAPSLLELTIHEAARLLDGFPDLNGYYAAGEARRHKQINVGFALNIGRGLRVPVVKGAAEMSLAEVSRSVRDLSHRYMRSDLGIDALVGGTFTITDLSRYHVHHFVPVLNDRQSAILGICAERPGTGHQDLVLTFDHRMTDGMRAALFLNELAARLEGAT